ncbi:MAG: DUF928 domain-containing protein [Synechococcales cyanobacterium RM1_1_8]|nr:DUF928 domain-containing protein [Synechococcales cyanobacterium RM1_1_8]
MARSRIDAQPGFWARVVFATGAVISAALLFAGLAEARPRKALSPGAARSRQVSQQQGPPPGYTPPPDRGTPPSTHTTGSRGSCFRHSDRPPLAALVGQGHLSWTISDRPTIWIYNPYTQAEAVKAELVLQAESGDRELYRGTFPLGQAPGIQGIPWPAALAPTEVGQVYRWYVDISCEGMAGAGGLASGSGAGASVPASLTGLVERVSGPPGLGGADQAGAGLGAIARYGQSHLWYDMVTALAQLRLASPGEPELARLWRELLGDEANVGLGFLAEAVLLGEVGAD